MGGSIRKPDTKYKQGRAVCKLLTMRWAALLVGSHLPDKTIMDWIDGSNLVPTHKHMTREEKEKRKETIWGDDSNVMKTFNNKNQSKIRASYNGGRTDVNTLYGNYGTLIFRGVFLRERSLDTWQDIVGELSSCLDEQGGGFTVSLHYKYPLDDKKNAGGHSVGFFVKASRIKAEQRGSVF
jgi:hypothetical protein